MSLHKSGAQKRKEKKKRANNERRGLQTLFQVGMRRTHHNVEIVFAFICFFDNEHFCFFG